MLIGSIGDIHGRDVWKQIVYAEENVSIDKWVFLADYVDAYDKQNDEVVRNLLELIELKKSNPSRYDLLIGNHDAQYFFDDMDFRCSGFRPEMFTTLNMIFNENKNLFQAASQYGDYLYTHAGVHSAWYNKHLNVLNQFEGNYADKINSAFKSRHFKIFADVGRRRGGWSEAGSPIWADSSETIRDDFPINQVIGHNRVGKIHTVARNGYSLTFTDCLSRKVDFFELTIMQDE